MWCDLGNNFYGIYIGNNIKYFFIVSKVCSSFYAFRKDNELDLEMIISKFYCKYTYFFFMYQQEINTGSSCLNKVNWLKLSMKTLNFALNKLLLNNWKVCHFCFKLKLWSSWKFAHIYFKRKFWITLM